MPVGTLKRAAVPRPSRLPRPPSGPLKWLTIPSERFEKGVGSISNGTALIMDPPVTEIVRSPAAPRSVTLTTSDVESLSRIPLMTTPVPLKVTVVFWVKPEPVRVRFNVAPWIPDEGEMPVRAGAPKPGAVFVKRKARTRSTFLKRSTTTSSYKRAD